jgi:hypothetical protein
MSRRQCKLDALRPEGVINNGLTYVQKSELKQPLICYFEAPSKKVVAPLKEGQDIKEGKTGKVGGSILLAWVAATVKYDRQKQAKSH